MLVLAGVAFMIYSSRKVEEAKTTDKDIARAESTAEEEEHKKEEELVGQLVPLETFLVNLAGSKNGRLMKVTMSLEVDSADVQAEIEKRKPQIRDNILILLSSKTFEQVSSKDGKDFLRDEVRDSINSYLKKGRVKRVLFTEFFYN